MSDDICRTPHPKSGLRCGLYKWHREDNTPHRVLKQDYPYNRMLKQQRQWQREWEISPRDGETP